VCFLIENPGELLTRLKKNQCKPGAAPLNQWLSKTKGNNCVCVFPHFICKGIVSDRFSVQKPMSMPASRTGNVPACRRAAIFWFRSVDLDRIDDILGGSMISSGGSVPNSSTKGHYEYFLRILWIQFHTSAPFKIVTWNTLPGVGVK